MLLPGSRLAAIKGRPSGRPALFYEMRTFTFSPPKRAVITSFPPDILDWSVFPEPLEGCLGILQRVCPPVRAHGGTARPSLQHPHPTKNNRGG
jgi:hypothetical protein